MATSGLPVLGVLLFAAVAVHETVYVVRHAIKCRTGRLGDKCTCPLTHRFLAGRAFHGFVVTDATYWTKADKTHGHVSPFQKLPTWQRRALRTGPVLAVGGALISWPLTAAVVGIVVLAAGGRWAARHTSAGRRAAARLAAAVRDRAVRLVPKWLRERLGGHHGSRMQDMAQALASITGSASVALKPQIDWNPSYASAKAGDPVATWYLPTGFKADGREKGKVEDLWRGRTGFDLVFTWKTADVPPKVVMTRAKQMRSIVYLRDVLDELGELDDGKSGIGLNDQNKLVCWNWNTENPHGVMNGGSRIGKTEINKCLVAQILRKGGGVTYIDPKEISLQGMEGIPGLTLVNDPGDIPAMWEAIADFRHLMDARRIERSRLGAEAVAGWTRQLLILEEVNQFSEQSDDFWEELPEEDEELQGTEMWKPRKAKKTPRVWRHVKAVAWQGAAFKMHVFVDGQDVQSMVLKGVRNSLGMRLLGGYLPSQWKFLVGTTPVPAAPNHKGRFCLVIGNDQTWLQAILGDKDPDVSSALWRDYALNGRPLAGAEPVGPSAWQVGSDGQAVAVAAGGVPLSQQTAVLQRADLRMSQPGHVGHRRPAEVTLAEAAHRGITGTASDEAVRKQLRRDREKAPQPVGKRGGAFTYDSDDLSAYAIDMKWVVP